MFKRNGGAIIYSACQCSLCKPNLDTLEQERSWGKRSSSELASRKRPSPLPPPMMVSPYVWAHIEGIFLNKEEEEVKPKGLIVLKDPLGSLTTTLKLLQSLTWLLLWSWQAKIHHVIPKPRTHPENASKSVTFLHTLFTLFDCVLLSIPFHLKDMVWSGQRFILSQFNKTSISPVSSVFQYISP